MDKQVPSNGHVEPGISIRMGPVDDMDVDTNGNANGKRKSRGSIPTGKSYKEQSSSEDDDDKPLVGLTTGPLYGQCANSPLE
jgi:DNA topoisomerase-1